MGFIDAMCLILVFQALGEVISFATQLPIPGPVLGMVMLVGFQFIKPSAAEGLRPSTNALLKYLSLFFIPAAVGIMQHTDRIAREWVPIIVTIVTSTVLAMGVTVLVVDRVRRMTGQADVDADDAADDVKRDTAAP